MNESGGLPVVTATFVVVGFDGDPAEITSLLGVAPDDSGRAGDVKAISGGGRVVTVKDNFWELHASVDGGSFLLQDYIGAVLERIKPLEGKLSKLPPGSMRKILIQASIEKDGHVPGLYLKHADLQLIARLGIDIDVDIN